MKTKEAKNKIRFYTSTYFSVIEKSIKSNIDGLECGRIALQLIGCPNDVALEIERLSLIQLKKITWKL